MGAFHGRCAKQGRLRWVKGDPALALMCKAEARAVHRLLGVNIFSSTAAEEPEALPADEWLGAVLSPVFNSSEGLMTSAGGSWRVRATNWKWTWRYETVSLQEVPPTESPFSMCVQD